MKTLLLLLLIVPFTVNAQKLAKFLNTPYTYDQVNAIKDEIIKTIDADYKMMSMEYPQRKNIIAEYQFLNSNGETLDITITCGFTDVDADLGKKGQPVIEKINITGFFPDAFRIYKALFNPLANMDEIKIKGSAEPIGVGKSSVSFFRNGKPGYWLIWDRKL